eukprot:sb/3474291/
MIYLNLNDLKCYYRVPGMISTVFIYLKGTGGEPDLRDPHSTVALVLYTTVVKHILIFITKGCISVRAAVYTFSYSARQRFDSYRIFLRSNSSFQNCPHFLSSPTGSRVSKSRPASLALVGAEPRFVSALVNTGRRLARQ